MYDNNISNYAVYSAFINGKQIHSWIPGTLQKKKLLANNFINLSIKYSYASSSNTQ